MCAYKLPEADLRIGEKVTQTAEATPQSIQIEIVGKGTFDALSVDGPTIKLKGTSGTAAGSDQFATGSISIREFGDVTIVRNYTPVQSIVEWLTDTIKGEDWRRDVAIIYPNRRWVLKDCFLTKYEISDLNTTASNVPAKETIGICIGYVENM